MRIIVACDSFKDALDASAVCEAIADGLRRAIPRAEVIPFPLADGGEGTAAILTRHAGGSWEECRVEDPLGRPIVAGHGLSADGKTAFIDLSAASGLPLLAVRERDPLRTSTYGTGQLLLRALEVGAVTLYLGLGGSATNDAGLGLARALGYRFFARDGRELAGAGAELEQLHRIDASGRHPRLKEVCIRCLCDVGNPLLGPAGAARTYAPQKGADEEAVTRLEAGAAHWAEVVENWSAGAVAHRTGAGAAGGAGAGALAFLGAELLPGGPTVLEQTGFAEQLKDCRWVITGEGRLDGQTAFGKLIAAVCRVAAERQVPVIALCGALSAEPSHLERLGLRAAFSISPGPGSLEDALRLTPERLRRTAWQVGRILHA